MFLCDRVPASYVTHQLLGSYAVQSDIGDYDVDEHGSGIAYIKDIQFANPQSDELLDKIAKLHMLNRSVIVAALSPINQQEAFEKCWAHSLLRAAVTLPVTRCR